MSCVFFLWIKNVCVGKSGTRRFHFETTDYFRKNVTAELYIWIHSIFFHFCEVAPRSSPFCEWQLSLFCAPSAPSGSKLMLACFIGGEVRSGGPGRHSCFDFWGMLPKKSHNFDSIPENEMANRYLKDSLFNNKPKDGAVNILIILCLLQSVYPFAVWPLWRPSHSCDSQIFKNQQPEF